MEVGLAEAELVRLLHRGSKASTNHVALEPFVSGFRCERSSSASTFLVTVLLPPAPPGSFAGESCNPATSSNDGYIQHPAACTFRKRGFRARSPAIVRSYRASLRGAAH